MTLKNSSLPAARSLQYEAISFHFKKKHSKKVGRRERGGRGEGEGRERGGEGEGRERGGRGEGEGRERGG